VRQLEVVAVSDDGSYVLLAGEENAARATHAVRIDNRLHAAIRGELDDSDERRESELSPRDIQARLRAGESTEDVAKAAKVPVARVMRYAGPVLSERERIVQQAQTAVLQRARGPELTTPLGEVVEKRLAETAGLRPDTVVWDARRRDDGAWVVVLSYSARGGARTASWLWQPTERELTSLNSLATRLGAEASAGGGRRKRAAAAKPASRRRTPAKRTTRKRATATKRSTSKRTASKRTASKRTASKRTASKRTASKRTAAKSRTAKSTTARRTPAKRAAAKRSSAAATRAKPVAKRTARAPAKPAAKRAPKRAAKRTTRTTPPEQRRPPREPPLIEPTVRRKNGRVEMPSWSEVLLGVQAPAAARGRRES
jgi:hypothetical protein